MTIEYDVAQICENGHVINKWTRTYPENSKKFCDDCGSPTITNCPACNFPIRGDTIRDFPNFDFKAPRFCLNCGGPFPWTKSKIEAARELAQEIEGLDEQDRAILEKSIDDLVKDSPATALAATRFKKIMTKAGKGAATMFREILVDVLSEAAKKSLYP